MADFNFLSGLLFCWGMSCYATIDATDPNIAAIRGLAWGLVGLARLCSIVAQHACLCHWSPPALRTSVRCNHDDLDVSQNNSGDIS